MSRVYGVYLPRLAGYDRNGDEIFDTDVLTAEEIAEDRGLIPRRPTHRQPPEDTRAAVDLLAALQESSRRAAAARRSA